ncbi:uncharacterized protein [Eleutherodactylus coqui]|uniref:uncharacterized protein n=1 Tax=Eleutherodactylus coqui TaxID=57060 RepID=UPI0034637670
MQKSLVLMFAVIYCKVTIHGLANDFSEGSNTTSQELSENKDNTKATPCMSLRQKLKHFNNRDLANQTLSQINSLIWMMQQALVSLKEQQLKIYNETKLITKCPMPLLPTNGGLVCAYFDDICYCKPMCNQGYDFSFLRRSRLYETCGPSTAFSWTSQYIGGNRLAECTASDTAISGQSSTYFKNEKCQEALSKGTENAYIEEFIKELKDNGITNNHNEYLDVLRCG